MEEELVLVVSRNKTEARDVCSQISNILQKKGLESSPPLCLPKMHITEAKRVVLNLNEEPKEKHRWLNGVKRSTIENLGHYRSYFVRGYRFIFRRRINFDGEELINQIDETSSATIVQTTRIQKSAPETTNAPFSYDPSQDFVTEI